MNLAQLNIARIIAPSDDPRVADFMANVDRLNEMGKRMPGFVYLMQSFTEQPEGGFKKNFDGDPMMLPNLSVWTDAVSLENYIWNTLHKKFYERRHEWFEILDKPYLVMWWVEEGHEPDLDEGIARLEHYRKHGNSDHAFGWSHLPEATLWRKYYPAEAA